MRFAPSPGLALKKLEGDPAGDRSDHIRTGPDDRGGRQFTGGVAMLGGSPGRA